MISNDVPIEMRKCLYLFYENPPKTSPQGIGANDEKDVTGTTVN